MVAFTMLCVFLVSLFYLIVIKILDKNPPPIFGVYRQQNGIYWFKVMIMYIMLSLKKVKIFLSPRSKEYMAQLDTVQKLAANDKAVDAVFFNGANKHGDHVIFATARRKHRPVDGFLFLKLNSLDIGVLQLPKAPDTSLFNEGNEDSYEAEGIKITPLEPMKKWRLTYKGQLKELNNSNRFHDVTIDGIWTSDEPWFSYDTDMDPWDMAKVIAYEKWSRAYFEILKQVHQTHYEQFGILKAKIYVDNKEYYIELNTLRDHSIAERRDWSQYRRYGMHFVTTENGDHFSVGSICIPLCFSRLKVGYVYNAKERKMYPVVGSNLELYQHGELGDPPKDFAFTFKAGKTEYTMQVNVTDSPYLYISKKWDVKIYERLATFNVNGIKGWGAAEWLYRNVQGRNIVEEEK